MRKNLLLTASIATFSFTSLFGVQDTAETLLTVNVRETLEITATGSATIEADVIGGTSISGTSGLQTISWIKTGAENLQITVEFTPTGTPGSWLSGDVLIIDPTDPAGSNITLFTSGSSTGVQTLLPDSAQSDTGSITGNYVFTNADPTRAAATLTGTVTFTGTASDA